MKLMTRSAVAALGCLLAVVCMRAFGDAADDKVATLGFVAIVSPSSITQGYTVDFL